MSRITEALKQGRDIYICGDCAEDHGGVWPQDHAATFSNGICEQCFRDTVTCALSDWNWGRKTKLEREF